MRAPASGAVQQAEPVQESACNSYIGVIDKLQSGGPIHAPERKPGVGRANALVLGTAATWMPAKGMLLFQLSCKGPWWSQSPKDDWVDFPGHSLALDCDSNAS